MIADSQVLTPGAHRELSSIIDGEVLVDDTNLGMYATDASVYQIWPQLIVIPRHEKDVKAALKFADQYKLNVLPRGAGTSLAGQTTTDGMVLDFSKYMNQVLELNVEKRWVRVQPGIPRDTLNHYLAAYGLHFAPDPATSSRANIGGMIGNNSSGTKSILYGKTVDHVLELKVLLADGAELVLNNCDELEFVNRSGQADKEGEIYSRVSELIESHKSEIETKFPKVMRRVGGYNLDEFIHGYPWNLSKLIVGSEGTLATILEAKLNLVPLPKHKSVCVVHFDEVLDAIFAVEDMLQFKPSAIEILDKTVVDLSRKNLTTLQHCQFIEGNPAAILIVEFYDDDVQEVMDRPRRMIEDLKAKKRGYACPLFPEGSSYNDVWVIRKKGLGLMLGIKGNKKPLPFIEDAGIPINHLHSYIDRVLKVCKQHQTEVAMYAHASVGVIHLRPILDLRLEEDVERFKRIAEDTFQLVKEYGGSWSGEHGDGLVRSPFNKEFFGDELYEAFREIKMLFDPEWRMNPGKIIDAPSMDKNLRYGKEYKDAPVDTVFHFRRDNSFEDAVHMCTGVGECRKTLTGTMCPSFQATREEGHSTRGRANALRLAMSGQIKEGLDGKEINEVLDLCLSCKACKSECPSNVDMAKLKSEVRYKYLQKHGLKLRDRLTRDAMSLASMFSGQFAPLINLLQASWLGKAALRTFVGISSNRTMPAYTKENFEKWFHQKRSKPLADKGKVALFADSYIQYHEPQVGKAAVTLLESMGYEVLLAKGHCCQRPCISNGFLDKAKSAGEAAAKSLEEYFQEKIPVLVCEPSCASALSDDLPDLLDDEELANSMQRHVRPIEFFIADHIKSHGVPSNVGLKSDNLLLHGHCHQKAIYGTKSLHTIFNSFEGVNLQEPDSGCCGMAGSFGYEKEHYELSQKIGERVILPAVRDASSDTAILASGFSCRHQIEHFTNREPIHWLEIFDIKFQ